MNKNRPSPCILKYIPHGLSNDIYFPINETHPEYKNLTQFRNELFKNDIPEFVVFFNSRNIRRKQIPDILIAFRLFLERLTPEKASKCKLVLHTEEISEAGTDLHTVKEYFFDDNFSNNVLFSTRKLLPNQLNYLYNIADVQILISSNEGWGLTLTEAMLAGTPIIGNVTGGMQDQMRFVDNNNKWFTPSKDVPSNHRKTFTEHGEWVFPVYPSSRSIQGSPVTPYIFDDRCTWEDVAVKIYEVYNLPKEERKQRGLKGREWAISDEAGFTSKHQADRIIEALDVLFDTWKPREKYEVLNVTEYNGRTLNHEIIY
jgi:glycosyltransferase involved in cell wall biosynthesis